MDILKYNFFDQLKQLPFVEQIYIFGSRARGDNSKYSDIDMAVYCPTAEGMDWYKISDIIDEADTLLEIDCVRLDELKEGRFKDEILKEGVIIYDKNKK